MIGSFIRLLLAILIGTTLIGTPTVQAARASNCDAVVAGVDSSGDAPTPCSGKMPGCASMPGCGQGVSSLARIAVVADNRVWRAAIYWPKNELLDGLDVKPDHGPPIAISPGSARCALE